MIGRSILLGRGKGEDSVFESGQSPRDKQGTTVAHSLQMGLLNAISCMSEQASTYTIHVKLCLFR